MYDCEPPASFVSEFFVVFIFYMRLLIYMILIAGNFIFVFIYSQNMFSIKAVKHLVEEYEHRISTRLELLIMIINETANNLRAY